jgi:uncharacterized protein (DUF2141 family)
MRLLISLMAILHMIIITGVLGQEQSRQGDLTILINGFENNEGVVKIALSDTHEDYEAEDQAFRGVETKIMKETAIWTFEKVPFGEYAIKIYHDEDSDNELDTNFLGIPSESYGFSNNARGSFGPASWEDAKFLFQSPRDSLHITLD